MGFARTIHRVAGWCALVYALADQAAGQIQLATQQQTSASHQVVSAMGRVGRRGASIESFTFDDAQVVRVEQT